MRSARRSAQNEEPTRTASVDSEVAKVIDAWPTLPEAVQIGILAMVRAAQGNEHAK